MRTFFYVLIIAKAGDPAPTVRTFYGVIRAENEEQAREFGRRKFKHRAVEPTEAVSEIVQAISK